MAGTVEQKLAAQGIVLNEPRTPMANYVGFVRSGNLLFVSGQVCANAEGKLIATGKLGAGVTIEQGYTAAQGCGVLGPPLSRRTTAGVAQKRGPP